MIYRLYEVDYISYEGNYRSANIILYSDENYPYDNHEDNASSTYYSNSGCYGDDPSTMVCSRFVTECSSLEEMEEYCGKFGVFAEYYEV